MITDTTGDALPPNGFLAVLQRKEMLEGTLTEASEVLGDASRAAAMSGKKATVTLVVTINPRHGALDYDAKIVSKMPDVRERQACIFYVGDDGKLYRNDPRQKELALSLHKGGASEPEKTASIAVNQ